MKRQGGVGGRNCGIKCRPMVSRDGVQQERAGRDKTRPAEFDTKVVEFVVGLRDDVLVRSPAVDKIGRGVA